MANLLLFAVNLGAFSSWVAAAREKTVDSPFTIPQAQPPRYFNQTLDHFNVLSSPTTFTQRYYLDSSAWAGAAELGPILFIPGGEWSVGPTKGLLYGQVRELCVSLHGICMIAEHRFYGDSIPFGGSVEEAFIPRADRLGLLTVEQAMADYAKLIEHVKEEHDCPLCPVLAFGGSYSGKLSAYLRLKYPTVVDIAHAASAPIKLDSVGMVDPLKYYEIVTSSAEKIRPGCPAAVRQAFADLRDASVVEQQEALGLCQPATVSEFGWNDLEFYITQYFATMAMFNYPPATSRLGADCDRIMGNASTGLKGRGLAAFKRLLAPHANVSKGCFDIQQQAPADVPSTAPSSSWQPPYYPDRGAGPAPNPPGKGTVSCSDWSGCGPGTGGMAWDFIACTEVLQPLGTNNM